MGKLQREPTVIVERITTRMEEKGWGMGQLAIQAEVDYNTVYKVMTHPRPRTSAEIIAKIAKALGCSVDYLVGLTDSPVPYVGMELSTITQNIMALAAQLSPRRQRDLEEMVRGLLMAQQKEADAPMSDILNQQLMDFIEQKLPREAADELFGMMGRPRGTGSSADAAGSAGAARLITQKPLHDESEQG